MTDRPESRTIAERDDIAAAVRGQTVISQLVRTAREREHATAIRWRQAEGDFAAWTWRRYADEIARFAAGLRGLGVAPGDRVLLRLHNRPEFHSSDMGVLAHRCVTATASVGSAPDQVRYLARHSRAAVVVFDDAEACEALAARQAELPHLRRIVLLAEPGAPLPQGVLAYRELVGTDPVDLEEAAASLRPEDPLNFLYTSGTTGPPKGVRTNHGNICWWAESIQRVLGDYTLAGKRLVSYLPMEIMAVRLLHQYLHAIRGTEIVTCPDPQVVSEYMRAVRPNIFLGVPRVWEGIYSTVRALLAADPEREKRFDEAVELGREVEAHRAGGQALPAELAERWSAVDGEFFRPVREAIGLDQCEIAVSGTAPIPVAIVEFLLAMGLPLSESYGLAEATAITFAPFRRRAGTAGRPIPGCEIRITDDGEIAVRSGNVFEGYCEDPRATAEALDAEGWFYTGDLGAIDDDGYVTIIGRKKELIITSLGRNVSPTNLEAALRGASPLVGQACVVGDNRPFIAALLVLDRKVAEAWARAHGIEAVGPEALARHPAVQQEIGRCVERVNATLSVHEHVARFTVLGDAWEPGTEVMSPALKLLRDGIQARYAGEIEAMYADA